MSEPLLSVREVKSFYGNIMALKGVAIDVAEGEIVEYASNCAAPIVHKKGDIRPETNPTSHWWKNLGTKTVVLYVGDVLHDMTDKNM